MINDNFIKRPAAKLEVTKEDSGLLLVLPPFAAGPVLFKNLVKERSQCTFLSLQAVFLPLVLSSRRYALRLPHRPNEQPPLGYVQDLSFPS